MPATPSSRTSTFDPPPRSRACRPSSRQRSTTASSSSTDVGSAKNCAGPPSLNQVRSASGTCSRTQSIPVIVLSLLNVLECCPNVDGKPPNRQSGKRSHSGPSWSGRAALPSKPGAGWPGYRNATTVPLPQRFVRCDRDGIRQIQAADVGIAWESAAVRRRGLREASRAGRPTRCRTRARRPARTSASRYDRSAFLVKSHVGVSAAAAVSASQLSTTCHSRCSQ